MSSGQKNSKRSGLRILWIPGKMRHNRKGRVTQTNSQKNSYIGKHQKKIEAWSLGGGHTQRQLISADLSESTEAANNISRILPLTATVAGGQLLQTTAIEEGASGVTVPKVTTTTATITSSNEMKLDDEANNPNKFSILGNCNENGKPLTPPASPSGNECKQNDNHTGNYNTLPASEKRERNSIKQNNLDTIELLEDDVYNNKALHLDHPDGGFPRSVSQTSLKKKHKKKKKKSKKDDIEGKEEDDKKTVECLYYTLMCCECSIS